MEHTVTDVDIRDKYLYKGKQMQNYAIALQGEEGWITLTQLDTTPPPQVGDKLSGNIEDRRTPQGESYRKFKKEYGSQQPGGVQDDSKLDYIVKMLEELTGRRATADAKGATGADEDPFKDL